MTERLSISFSSLDHEAKGLLVVLSEADLGLGKASKALLKPAGDLLKRAAAADGFTGLPALCLTLSRLPAFPSRA